MSDPFHHKHPYLTVIMLLIILLVVSEFFSSMFWPRHNYDHHYGHRYGGDYGHHHRYHGGGAYDRDEGPRWRNLRRHPFAEGKPYHMRRVCRDGMQRWTESRLYLGRGADGGVMVSDADWAQFVQEIIRPRLPLGFTVVETSGYWGEASGAFHAEQTQMLILLHDGSKDKALNEITAAYKTRYERNIVLRTDSPECVAFR